MSAVHESTQSENESHPATGLLRLVCQLAGLGLLLLGCYYSLSIAITVLGYVRDPQTLQEPAGAMALAVGLDQTTVALGESKLPLGRTVGMVFLCLWYFIASVISLSVVSVGGKLMTTSINERREFYGAVREMMLAIRREKEEAASKH